MPTTPQPKPATDTILDRLNTIRISGRIHQNDLEMARLRKDIEKLTNSDPSYYRVTLSAFCGMTGEYDQMLAHGSVAVRSYLRDDIRIFYATTLLNTGFFSEAANILSECDYSTPDLAERKLVLNILSLSLRTAVVYTDLVRRANIDIDPIRKMDVVMKATDILRIRDVDDLVVQKMLDIAGDVLREHSLVRKFDPRIIPCPSDKTVTILLPVDMGPREVADLDWEYSMRLFECMPNAPATCVHIGFAMADHDNTI